MLPAEKHWSSCWSNCPNPHIPVNMLWFYSLKPGVLAAKLPPIYISWILLNIYYLLSVRFNWAELKPSDFSGLVCLGANIQMIRRHDISVSNILFSTMNLKRAHIISILDLSVLVKDIRPGRTISVDDDHLDDQVTVMSPWPVRRWPGGAAPGTRCHGVSRPVPQSPPARGQSLTDSRSFSITRPVSSVSIRWNMIMPVKQIILMFYLSL